ncbi:hypothetical protein Bca101_049391 [Brassica carinata]
MEHETESEVRDGKGYFCSANCHRRGDHKAGYKRDQTKSGEEVGGLHGPLRASSHIIVSQVDLTTSQKFVRIKRKRKLPRRRGCKSCITMEITNQDEYREIMGRGRESYEEK